MTRFPKDNQAALIKFYGKPKTAAAKKQIVKIQPPFKMYYNGKQVSGLSFHKKAAPALSAALKKIWDYYGRDQAVIDRLGISKTAGTYNPRKVRGSKTKWSNHAYGAAIDINAEENGFNVAGNIPLPVIAAFKSEGFSWGGDYKRRKDPMHFEACDRGEPERTFEEWLSALGVKRKVAAMPAFALSPDQSVRGDAEVWNIQRRLKAMKYNPGGLDGIWGGMTSGAISGFINDRQSNIEPPASAETFLDVLESLKAEIAVAEGERFVRPIAPERAEATPAEVGEKLPEVKASIAAERGGFWASITTAVAAVITGVSKFFGDAVEWLNPIKEFASDLPWQVWVGGALIVALALYIISLKSGQAKNAATQAYQEGARV